MQSSLVRLCKSSPGACLALIASLTLLLSGWTCTGSFQSCLNQMAPAEITSLVPGTIWSGSGEVLLTVGGNGFTPQSRILWNGSTLETRFVDAQHLQTTITREIFDNFGGSAGNSVSISVLSENSLTCSTSTASEARPLIIQ